MNYISMNIEPEKSGARRLMELSAWPGKTLSCLEFRSSLFEAYPGEKRGRAMKASRKRALSFMSRKLEEMGYLIRRVHNESWGSRLALEKDGVRFALSFGSYGQWSDRFLCVIEHPAPRIRRWFRRVPTDGLMDTFFEDLEEMLSKSEEISGFHWLECD